MKEMTEKDRIDKIDTRTRMILSMRELLQSQSFEHITVNDVVEASGVSRQTFYRYFPDKYGLLYALYKYDTEPITNRLDIDCDFPRYAANIAEYLYCHRKVYKSVLTGNYYTPNPFFISWYNSSIHFLSKHIKNNGLREECQIPIMQFILGSTYVNCQFMESKLKNTPEKLGYQIAISMPEILKPHLYVDF